MKEIAPPELIQSDSPKMSGKPKPIAVDNFHKFDMDKLFANMGKNIRKTTVPAKRSTISIPNIKTPKKKNEDKYLLVNQTYESP